MAPHQVSSMETTILWLKWLVMLNCKLLIYFLSAKLAPFEAGLSRKLTLVPDCKYIPSPLLVPKNPTLNNLYCAL